MNLVTSYTKHGHGIEALGTFTKVREYLDTFTIPYIWGGDFNRPPEQLSQETASNGLGIRCFAPQGVYSTCSNGGLIDYFASHVNETDILQDVAIVRDAPIAPHFPVQARVPANIKDTMVKTQVTAPEWPVLIGPLLEPWTWEQSQRFLADQQWKAPKMAFSDARQEYYSIGIGTQQASVRLADSYSTWSATSAVQYLSQHTKDVKELKSYLSLGQQGKFDYQPRRPKVKENVYTDKHLGIVVELKKNMTSIVRLHEPAS